MSAPRRGSSITGRLQAKAATVGGASGGPAAVGGQPATCARGLLHVIIVLVLVLLVILLVVPDRLGKLPHLRSRRREAQGQPGPAAGVVVRVAARAPQPPAVCRIAPCAFPPPPGSRHLPSAEGGVCTAKAASGAAMGSRQGRALGRVQGARVQHRHGAGAGLRRCTARPRVRVRVRHTCRMLSSLTVAMTQSSFGFLQRAGRRWAEGGGAGEARAHMQGADGAAQARRARDGGGGEAGQAGHAAPAPVRGVEARQVDWVSGPGL